MDVKTLLGSGYDLSLVGLDVFEVGPDRVRARLTVSDPLQNVYGKLHGGAIATLVDDIGTVAVFSADRYQRPGVTTDLNVTYLAPARAGESVLIEAEVLKCGLTMAFVQVTVKREPRGELIACGRMTKALGERSPPTSETAPPRSP
jgi:acyl-coenzyme A thioesterase 13